MAYNKPRPNLDEDIKPFWDAMKEHQFKLFRCKQCGEWYWPFAYCRFHENEPFGANIELAPASGRGKVYAFNIHKVAFDPAFADDIPYVYALIELEEGPMFGTNVVGCDTTDVYIGMPVEVTFEDIEGEFTLPRMKPVAS